MDTPIERAPLAPDLSQARYAVDLTGLVPAEVAAGLPPLPPNHFYFYPPDPLVEGDGAITAIEDSDPSTSTSTACAGCSTRAARAGRTC